MWLSLFWVRLGRSRLCQPTEYGRKSCCVLSRVQLFANPWTVAHQASLSMGILQAKYWSGLCSPPGDLPNLGIEPRSPALQADSLPAEPPWNPKNTGLGSLSLLQGIVMTQESNRFPALQAYSLPAELPGKRIHMALLIFQILFPLRLLQNIE